MPDAKSIWKEADSWRGCLAHLKQTRGRRRHRYDGDPLAIENAYVSDEAKVLSSKSFRVLRDKTQVFTFPRSALIRDRKTHVLEVVAVSVVTSELLGLNTDLVRAAALGHDIGHVPFGHQGEVWIAKAMGRPEFCHEVLAPVIAQRIERSGRGLNLSHQTLEAMMRHSGNLATDNMSQEAWVLRYADKFAYIFADINDILKRMRYPVSGELRGLVNEFGGNQRERTSTAIAGLIIESASYKHVSFQDSDLAHKFARLRTLMYEVYVRVTQQDVGSVMGPVLDFLEMIKVGDPFLLLSLMTDKDVASLAAEPMKDMQAFNRTTISEIIPHLQKIGKVDLCNPDLDW